MIVLDVRQIEAQAILMERVERYRPKHGLLPGDAMERLVRAGLFIEALPDGSVLVRRDGRAAWCTPSDDPQKAWRGGASADAEDVPF